MSFKTKLIHSLLLSVIAIPQAFAVNASVELDKISLALGNIEEEEKSASCNQRYARLFRDDTLNITIGLGYSENPHPGVMVFDRHFEYAFRRALTKTDCLGVAACGFTQDAKNNRKFTKTITGPSGKPHKVQIDLIVGSLSLDHSLNTSPKYLQHQMKLCAESMNSFMNNAANGAEVVFYSGHSRDGGGPSFCPPKRTDNQHVDYDWYHKNPVGFQRLLKSMKTAKGAGKPNEVIGMYSCYSKKHFYKKFKEMNNSAGYLLTDTGPLMDENFYFMYSTLDSLLAQRCAKGMRKSLGIYNSFPHMKMMNIFSKN